MVLLCIINKVIANLQKKGVPMGRSALLMWTTVLLLGPSHSVCVADNYSARLPLTRSPTPRPSIYTPPNAPTYDGIYTPAYAPPLTRRYVPAYARTPATARTKSWPQATARRHGPTTARTKPSPRSTTRSNAAERKAKVSRPEPTKEFKVEDSEPEVPEGFVALEVFEAPPAAPLSTNDKPTSKPRKQTSYRPVHDTDSASIILNVPATATVWINGRKTTSQGTQRKYNSVGLQKGRGYRYRIVVQDGDRRSEREVVLTAGETKVVSNSPATR